VVIELIFKFLSKKKNKLKTIENGKNRTPLHGSEIPNYYAAGQGDLWDVLCPDGIDVSHPNHGFLTDSLSGPRPFRPVYITRGGWPRKLMTDWLSTFMSFGEVDLVIYNEKIHPRHAVHNLQKMLTILKSNYSAELKRGNIDQIHDLRTKISDTDALIEDVSLGENDLFHTSVQACIYAENEEILDQLSGYLEDELGGTFHLRSAYERIKEGYLSTLPRGKNEMLDTYRNLDRRSLSTLFPFASSELKYRGGVPFAVNQSTGNLVFLNLFAEEFNNYNAVLLGESGSGKTVTIDTLVGRHFLDGTYGCILDPEGEYRRYTKRLGGTYIKIGSETPIIINPCALSVTELELDDDDDELKFVEDGREIIRKADGKEYVRFVPVKDKMTEIISFFDMVVQGNHENGGLTSFELVYLQESMREVFDKWGITPNPQSLYQETSIVKNDEIIHDYVLKPEITLSDINQKLVEKYGKEPKAERLMAAIKPWLREGVWGLFDGETYFGEGVSTNIDDSKLVTFDISDLEADSLLRKLGYHVCLTWIWQKFVKSEKNAEKKKIVVADEFWQMVDSDQTVSFAERLGRRCRKRNTSFIIASQDAKRILENSKAYGVVTNCSTQLIFKQHSINCQAMKEAFNLSDGELSIVSGKPKKGEGLLRTQNESAWIRTDLFDYEKLLFESNRAKLKAMERQIQNIAKESQQEAPIPILPSFYDEDEENQEHPISSSLSSQNQADASVDPLEEIFQFQGVGEGE
jgi:hypothetical protein